MLASSLGHYEEEVITIREMEGGAGKEVVIKGPTSCLSHGGAQITALLNRY